MPKKAPAKAVAASEADPRFEPVARSFARTPGFSLMESKSRATRGLMLHGKSFGMSSHGRLILKLNEERAAALIGKGTAKPFAASPGKVMKGWVEVTHPRADWVALAKEAQALAAAGANGARSKRADADKPSRAKKRPSKKKPSKVSRARPRASRA